MFWRNGWFKNPEIWLAVRILDYISWTRFFPNTAFVQKHSKYYKFLLQNKFSEISLNSKNPIFRLFLVHFPSFFQKVFAKTSALLRRTWKGFQLHFWPCPPRNFLDQHAKNHPVHWFVLDILLIKKSCNLVGWEHFCSYLRNKTFSKYLICAGTQQITSFHYRLNLVKINDQIFLSIIFGAE